MSWTLDHSYSYQLVGGREAIKLYDNAGTMLGAIDDAKRLTADTAEKLPSHGEYIGTIIDWRLPAIQAPAVEILPGYRITDTDNIAYTILSADPPVYVGVWMCSCVALRTLGHTITVKLPTDSIDEYTSPITDQSRTIVEQPCAIQEISSEIVEFQHKQGVRRTYHIWVLTQPRLEYGSILEDERGYRYQVIGTTNRNKIDELCAIIAVQNP